MGGIIHALLELRRLYCRDIIVNAPQTHNKERRRNSVLHSRHVDVFNSNGEVYENACDLPPAAETVVAVTRVVEEESRDVRAGVLRYLIS